MKKNDGERPLLLLSNDDGFAARGLNFLIDVLEPTCDLIVVAPDAPRSGASCAFTCAQPLTYRKVAQRPHVSIYACSGTPVDCVKMGLNLLCRERRPDMVVAGVNHGDNASVNTHYSGTMGVAREGALQGIPAIAFSLCDYSAEADFEPLRPYVAELVDRTLAAGLPPMTCLNVNFPGGRKTFEGVRLCRMGLSRWQNEVEPRRHPYGRDYYWLAGESVNLEPDAPDTDRRALEEGWVAVTPTSLDVTDYSLLESLRATF
ncbi:MAG: 5'/3'-nucleotidase SurE [Prevotellaceae bacterium]|nr:5'/3'-nucleotidase SurE [Prevotellaceae bacterium]